MTTPDPDPPAPGPSSSDDSPTSPLDLPPFTAAEPPPRRPLPPPGAPAPGRPPQGSVPPAAPSPAARRSACAVQRRMGLLAAATRPRHAGARGSDATGPSSPARPGSGPNSQAALVIGLILVIIGAVVLVTRVADVTLGADAWPLWIVVPGLAMLVASFAVPPRGGLGLAVPGAIIATVGLVLWVQDAYDAYETWAYAWALVAPTAAGVGHDALRPREGRSRAGRRRVPDDARRPRAVRRVRAVLRGRHRPLGRADREPRRGPAVRASSASAS